jgi:hypothetical protein
VKLHKHANRYAAELESPAIADRDQSPAVFRALPPPRIILLALVWLCLAFIAYLASWKGAPYAAPDTPSYMTLAGELKHLNLTEVPARTPGLPILLLLTGSDSGPTRAFYNVSLALHFTSVGLLAWLLYELNLRLTWIAAFLAAGCMPPFVEWAAQMGTENLTEFLLVLTFVFLAAWLKRQHPILLVAYPIAALCLALTRPTFQVLVPTLAFCVLAFHQLKLLSVPLRRLLVFLAATNAIVFLALGGYAYFNYRRFGYFGTNMFSAYGTSSKVAGVLEFLPDKDRDIREILIKHRNALMISPGSDHTGQNYIYRALPDLTAYYHGDTTHALMNVQRLSLDLIRAKPMSYLNECTKAISGYWFPTDGPLSIGSSAVLRALWAACQLSIASAFLLQALAVTGYALFRLPRYVRSTGGTLGSAEGFAFLVCVYVAGTSIIWYTMLVSCCMGIGLSRYRAPTDLLIILTMLLGYKIWMITVCAQADSYAPMARFMMSDVSTPGMGGHEKAISRSVDAIVQD